MNKQRRLEIQSKLDRLQSSMDLVNKMISKGSSRTKDVLAVASSIQSSTGLDVIDPKYHQGMTIIQKSDIEDHISMWGSMGGIDLGTLMEVVGNIKDSRDEYYIYKQKFESSYVPSYRNITQDDLNSILKKFYVLLSTEEFLERSLLNHYKKEE